MRTRYHFLLLAAIFIAILGAAITPGARAVVLSGGAGSPAGSPGGFVGGGAGTVTWFDVHNTGAAHIMPYNQSNVEIIRRQLGVGKSNKKELLSVATNEIYIKCVGAIAGDDLFGNNSYLRDYPGFGQCPIWWNSRHNTGYDNSLTWYNLHSFWPNKIVDPTEDTLSAYNIKIWRENRNQDQMELIFARQLGVDGVQTERPGVDTLGTSAPNRRWWYGGNTTNPGGDGSLGGRFTLSSRTSAGPIGNFEGDEKANCIQNWNHGQNGLRSINGNITNPGSRVVQNVRPLAVPNSNFCYWEGDEIGTNPFRWSQHNNQLAQATGRFSTLSGDSSDVRNAQFGPPTPQANFGATSAGLKEAIFIQWSIPQGGSEPELSWKIEGAPGLFYGVQVIGVTGREQLKPITNPNTNTGQRVVMRQLIQATIVNPAVNKTKCLTRKAQLKSDHGGWSEERLQEELIKLGYKPGVEGPLCFPPGSTCPPSHPYYSTSCVPPAVNTGEEFNAEGVPPGVSVDLEADSPAQTRQHTDQKINVNVLNYSEGQAVFPYLSDLIHYTPQMRFSSPHGGSAQSGTYSYNYISYDDEQAGFTLNRRPAEAQLSGPPATPGHPAFNAQEVELQRALELERNPDGTFSNGAGPLTSVDYGMTWLQPTLSNPCTADPYNAKIARDNHFAWPSSPQACPVDGNGIPSVVNAWDDLLRAQAWWEERWQNGRRGSIQDPLLTGQIQDENLRCADPVYNPSGDPNGGKRVEDCANPSIGFFTNVDNITTQHAQGYLNVANDADRPGFAYIQMRTNRPARVTAANVTRRDTGTAAWANYMVAGNGITNSVTGYPQMSYCFQGLHGPDDKYSGEAAKVKLSIPGAPDRALDQANGDPQCRGYDSRWYWPEPADPGYVESCNAKPNRLPPVKPTGQGWPNVVINPVGYNGYGGSYRAHYGDVRPGLAYAYDPYEFDGSPYVGRRPGGSADTGNYRNCWELVPGRYTRGVWQRQFAFRTVGEGNNNCQFHYGDIYNASGGLRPAFQRPNTISEEGYGSRCASQWPGGAYKWRFGFYYPVRAVWLWTDGSEMLGVSNDYDGKIQTEIGPGQVKRQDGQWWNTWPTGAQVDANNWGKDGRFMILEGPQNHAPDSINQFFDDSVWVKMMSKEGYLTSGSWVLNRGPDEGWGANNSGFRLDQGGYLAEFTFQWPDVHTARSELAYSAGGPTPYQFPRANERCPIFAFNGLVPGTCWSMQADYEGYNNIQWRFAQGTNDSWEDSAYIKVYGPRNSR